MRKLLIDTDPGVDDALAILMALSEPSCELLAITTVGGNVGLEHTTRNALLLVQRFASAPVPVHAGAGQPLLYPAPDASFVHGSDGFGDAGLEVPKASASSQRAALAIVELADRHRGELELLALGPLTNVALALLLEPRLAGWLKRLVIMGGAFGEAPGNTTPFAEFNTGYDPEAARIVASRGPGATWVDWGLSLKLAPALAESENWFAGEAPRQRFLRAISRKTRAFLDGIGAPTWAWADPLAMQVLLEPGSVRGCRRGRVEVLCEAGPGRGTTLLARGIGSAEVVEDLDPEAWRRRIRATLAC